MAGNGSQSPDSAQSSELIEDSVAGDNRAIKALSQSLTPPAAPSGPNVVIWNGSFCTKPGNCGFVANVKTVAVGTTITWMNSGGMTHTVTTCDSNHSVSQCPALDASSLDSFDMSVASGASITHTFTLAGTYCYYCRPHPWMQGEITAQ